MSICASGSSVTRAGVPASVLVDRAYVQSLLPPALAFLYPFLPYMGGLEIGNVGAFCTADPPIVVAMPSAADILSFVTGGKLSVYLDVNVWFQNLLKTYLWYKLCHCSDLTDPAAPTPPANTGVPAIDPGPYVSLPPSTPCYSSAPQTRNTLGQSSTFGGWVIWTGYVPTVIVVTAAGVPTAGAGSRMQLLFSTVDANGVEQAGSYELAVTVPANGSASLTMSIPPSPNAGVEIDYTSLVDGGQSDVTWHIDAYCGTPPTAAAQPCCPPDPVLIGQINQILSLVTLIQRQHVPFSYIASTVHAGLTGSGTVAVQGLIGVLLTLTTLPTSIGHLGANPAELFDAGYVTVGNAAGWQRRERVDRSPLLLFPIDGAATVIGYDLNPLVVASVTELVREP